MKLTIVHQESYSRGELLLRTFFGLLYIGIPHGFLLLFLGIWSAILMLIAFFIVLFTGNYPRNFFEYQVNVMKWSLRVQSRIFNLSDGYPPFGLKATDASIELDIPYPEKLSRLLLIVRVLFGWIYIYIPHGFLLFFRAIGTWFVIFIAWWAVLITGKYPQGMHNFVVGFIRWSTRVSVYACFLSDTYPPFSGKE